MGVCLGVLACVLLCFSCAFLVLKGVVAFAGALSLLLCCSSIVPCFLLCLIGLKGDGCGCVFGCACLCVAVLFLGWACSQMGWLLLLMLFLCSCVAPPLFHDFFLSYCSKGWWVWVCAWVCLFE